MTNTNNGLPGKPGVPRNSSETGWHWVNGMPREWVVLDDGGSWRFAGSDYRPHEWAHRIYRGPCLTPDEATALQARVAELEEALDAAGRILHKAGKQFSEYAKQQAAKGTAVSDLKAAANKQWAERCFSAYWRTVEGGKDE